MASRSRRFSGLREDQVAQRAPVEFTVWRQDAGAESLDHGGKPGLPRRDDGAGRIIGVDHRNAELGESPRDRAFAACDAAGEADAQAAAHVSA